MKENTLFPHGYKKYIRTIEGWLYLATIIDLYSRKVIGYKMSNRMTKDLVISALLNALKSRCYPQGFIVHSDRGSKYASNEDFSKVSDARIMDKYLNHVIEICPQKCRTSRVKGPNCRRSSNAPT